MNMKCNDIDTVQEFWNNIEMKIINVVDYIVPVTSYVNNLKFIMYAVSLEI